MVVILQVERLNKARKAVCTTMEEWWKIDKYENNSEIVDKGPGFKTGSMIDSRRWGELQVLRDVCSRISKIHKKCKG